MLRLGILDFDTSHVVEFVKRINHLNIPEDQWVEGAKVVVGCAGESKLSPERIPGFVEQIKKMEVPLVDKPEQMIGKVDAMLIEAVDGSVHLERAKPFLEAGIPCYVDKPFACSLADAKAMVALAQKKKLPLFSSSSLRYAPEVVDFATGKAGKLIGTMTYGPCSLHERNPGLFHYGIHAVEILYTLMGPGCESVTAVHEKDVDVVTGQWKDGRVASVRGTRSGVSNYGFLAFTDKGVTQVNVGTKYIYRELLKQVIAMFTTGKQPVELDVMLEIVAFIEAAYTSAMNHGIAQKVSIA